MSFPFSWDRFTQLAWYLSIRLDWLTSQGALRFPVSAFPSNLTVKPSPQHLEPHLILFPSLLSGFLVKQKLSLPNAFYPFPQPGIILLILWHSPPLQLFIKSLLSCLFFGGAPQSQAPSLCHLYISVSRSWKGLRCFASSLNTCPCHYFSFWASWDSNDMKGSNYVKRAFCRINSLRCLALIHQNLQLERACLHSEEQTHPWKSPFRVAECLLAFCSRKTEMHSFVLCTCGGLGECKGRVQRFNWTKP